MDAKQELLMRLQQIVSEQLGVDEQEVTERSTWSELGADSLDRLETSRIIEDAFTVYIPHQMGERLNTVGETVEHILNVLGLQDDLSRRRIEAVATKETCSPRADEHAGNVFQSGYRA
jgi:acyl carrier protein